MTSRRGFLIGIGAALAAPAIIRVENLMKIVPVTRPLLPPSGVYNFVVQSYQSDVIAFLTERNLILDDLIFSAEPIYISRERSPWWN